MAHVTIQPEHLPALARMQHVLEFLQAEQARLHAELAHVATQGQRAEAELRAFLLHAYGIAPGGAFTLDIEANAITTPDEPGSEPDAPTSEPEPAPEISAAPDGG